jgi:predicted metal-dependent phosphoesterase TrpH
MAVNLQTSDSARVAAQNVSALKQVFKNIHPESCPRSFNFHMHTIHSDGKLKPEEAIEQAIAIGLKGLAITDHHTVSGYLKASHWLENWKHKHGDDTHNQAPHLWTGVEINADLLGTEVHILGYGFNPEHPCLAGYLLGHSSMDEDVDAFRVIAAIHQAGGVAVLAHPARYRRSPAELIPEAARLGIDGVEAYYAYDNPKPWRTSPKQTQLVQQLSTFYGLFNTCGTDTHGLSLLQRL